MKGVLDRGRGEKREERKGRLASFFTFSYNGNGGLGGGGGGGVFFCFGGGYNLPLTTNGLAARTAI